MEASKEKRDKYLESIKNILIEKIVYVDESGLDMTICQDKGWGKKGELLLVDKSSKHYQRTNISANN